MRVSTLLAANLAPLLVALPAICAVAMEASDRPFEVSEVRAPCESYDPLRRPFFGDTHVHTAFSLDASAQDTRNTPRDAYRFARGEPMGIQPYDENGRALRTIRLSRPLDFVAVTDHSELLGEVHLCTTPGSPAYSSWICRIHRHMPRFGSQLISGRTLILKSRWSLCEEGDAGCLGAGGGVWKQIQAAAEEAYDRSGACRFTSFVGYEWTASVGAGQNLHRNVIFRNDRVPDQPTSWVETPSAVDLWDRLEATCIEAGTGCDALTIPHNSNLGGGLMFQSASLAGSEDVGPPDDAGRARRRARWEPLVEIMQHKGDSECTSGAGTTDEACGFEKLPYDRFGARFSWFVASKEPGRSDYVRWALLEGLRLDAQLGANPFRYGIVASTDTHIAAPGLTEEKGHPGHGGAGIGAGEGVPQGFPDDLEFNPGGLAVLWAEENTRDALYAAMRRREAYGTSGTRPVVRLFGGWKYAPDLCDSGRFVEEGYAGGVPMGGELAARPALSGASPRLAVWALQDPGSAGAPGTPLQRVQIIKGWVEGDELRERVFDVAGGDNGASVDLRTCEPKGAGARSLCAVWTDPAFDADSSAFYYARVLENPTCRWSQYVCNAAAVDCANPDSLPEGLEGCCADTHRPAIQERAWTSPIWYEP